MLIISSEIISEAETTEWLAFLLEHWWLSTLIFCQSNYWFIGFSECEHAWTHCFCHLLSLDLTVTGFHPGFITNHSVTQETLIAVIMSVLPSSEGSKVAVSQPQSWLGFGVLHIQQRRCLPTCGLESGSSAWRASLLTSCFKTTSLLPRVNFSICSDTRVYRPGERWLCYYQQMLKQL